MTHPRTPAVHHIQAGRAFGKDPDHPARPATVVAVDGDRVQLRFLDGATVTVVVGRPALLRTVLEREDVCRLRGQPLALVNEHYGVLGVATGPGEPPGQLRVTLVSRMEDGEAVELLNDGDDQPSWQLLALSR